MRRRILIILIATLVLATLGVGIVLLVDRTPTLQNAISPNTNTAASNANVAPVGNLNTTVNPDRAAIEYVARNFSELYGSGTTQNNFANITDAKQWGTENFSQYLDRLIALERAKGPSEKFIRTISTALVIKVKRQAAAAAAVTVTLQRVESGDTDERQYYQDLNLDLIKQGSDWKINAAFWVPPA